MDMRQSDVESHQSITVLQMTRTKKPRKNSDDVVVHKSYC